MVTMHQPVRHALSDCESAVVGEFVGRCQLEVFQCDVTKLVLKQHKAWKCCCCAGAADSAAVLEMMEKLPLSAPSYQMMHFLCCTTFTTYSFLIDILTHCSDLLPVSNTC